MQIAPAFEEKPWKASLKKLRSAHSEVFLRLPSELGFRFANQSDDLFGVGRCYQSLAQFWIAKQAD